MKGLPLSLGFCTGVGLFLVLLIGCSSTPSKYYVLSSIPGESTVQDTALCLSVGVGPIKLPEYVNRLEIVAHATQNELSVSDSHLWAEPLSDSVPRVLGEDISRLICTKEISLFPWKPSRMPDYRVDAEVVHMRGNLGSEVSFEVWWGISYGPDKTARVSRISRYSVPVADRSYEALVQAYSQGLAALSRDVADALKELSK
jgi:uncharacterized protein